MDIRWFYIIIVGFFALKNIYGCFIAINMNTVIYNKALYNKKDKGFLLRYYISNIYLVCLPIPLLFWLYRLFHIHSTEVVFVGSTALAFIIFVEIIGYYNETDNTPDKYMLIGDFLCAFGFLVYMMRFSLPVSEGQAIAISAAISLIGLKQFDKSQYFQGKKKSKSISFNKSIMIILILSGLIIWGFWYFFSVLYFPAL